MSDTWRLAWLLAAVVALNGCRTSDRSVPAELLSPQFLTWQSPLGPGGADVPPWPILGRPDETPQGFSRLLGVLLMPETQELVWVGVEDSTRPALDVDDLMDALTIAVRAMPGAPGVSIDPTAEQVVRGPKAGDLMAVRYINGDAQTVTGDASFEADRLMKCLSLGTDNLSGRPVTCGVPEFRTELDAVSEEPATERETWHRFWIEQQKSPVEISASGRMLLFDAKLRVETEYMDAVGGELRASKRPATGAAKRFADHLTAHYDEYAREFPVFNSLRAFAQMTTLASALAADTSSKAFEDVRSRLELSRLLGWRNVRAVDTPVATPAIVASTAAKTFSGTVSLTGGVDLTPHPEYVFDNRSADSLERAVLAAVNRDRGRPTWRIVRGRETLVAAARSLAGATRLWQTDLKVGRLRFARELHGDDRSPTAGTWDPMLPGLQFSPDRVTLERLGSMARAAIVTTPDGERTWLGQHAQLEMPGQPPTRGFVDAELPPPAPGSPAAALPTLPSSAESPRRKRRRPRQLYLYADRFILVDGPVRYVLEGGQPRFDIPPGASVTEFSSQAPYRPMRSHSAEGTMEILWRDGRLIGYQAASGERIDVLYDASGRMRGLQGSDGQAIEYRFDRDGWLYAAVDQLGNSVTYQRPSSGGSPSGVAGVALDATSGGSPFGRFSASPGSPEEALRRQTAELTNRETIFVGLHDAPAQSDHAVRAFVAGQPVAANVERAAEAVLDLEHGNGPQSAALRASLFSDTSRAGASTMVVVDKPYLRNTFGRAIVEVAPTTRVFTAADATRAAGNLAALQKTRSGFSHYHLSEGMEKSVDHSIRELAQTHPSGGDLLIVSGHNSAQYAATLKDFARTGKLRGKAVLLATCGGVESGEWDALFIEGGALLVARPSQPVPQPLLAQFLKELHHELNATKEPPARAIDRIMRDAIEKLRTQPGTNPDDLRSLQRVVIQIGEVRNPSDLDRVG